MSKSISPLWYVGGAAAAYFLFLAPKSGAASPLSSILPASSTVGVNSGVKGGNGSFYTVSNYSTLLAANPNLGNPNYQMTPAEINQYMSNYSDLQQAFPGDISSGAVFYGVKSTSIAQLAQLHWTHSGCAEQRIFLPMNPPSTAAYIPPPPVPAAAPAKSGGGGFLSGVLGVATSVLPYVAMLAGEYNAPQLNDADCQLLFSSAAIIKQILPLYSSANIIQMNNIENTLDGLLKQYV